MEAILKTDTAEISADDLIKVYDTRIEQLVQLKNRYKKLHYKKYIELFQNEMKYMWKVRLGVWASEQRWSESWYWDYSSIKYCKKDPQYVHWVGDKCNMSHNNSPTINTLIRKKRVLIDVARMMFNCISSKIRMYTNRKREESKREKVVELHKEHKEWLDKYANYEEWKLFTAEEEKTKRNYEAHKKALRRSQEDCHLMEERLVRQIDTTNILEKRVADLHVEIKNVKIELLEYKPVKCPVCHDMIEGKPVILSCAHYICASCFSTMVQLNHKRECETKCHMCRTKI